MCLTPPFEHDCSEGNPEEQPCQPEENLALPDSFTQIYILFLIGFRIGPPKMPRRFRIGLPKMHRRFNIGPPESVLALLNPHWPSWICIGAPEMHRRGILMYPVYYVRKALKKPIWNRMAILSSSRTIILGKVMERSVLVSVERCFVSRMQDFW